MMQLVAYGKQDIYLTSKPDNFGNQYTEGVLILLSNQLFKIIE